MAKPAAKPAAAAATDAAADAPPKKSKKKLIITVVAALLLIGGGAAAYLLLIKPAHIEDATGSGKDAKNAAAEKAEEEARDKTPAKFVELGTFTANLVREEGDQYLQVGISLKLSKPELEERIKANSPEILHRVNMVLQSKRPSEINTYEGKMKLAGQIKEQAEYVIGLRKTAPPIGDEPAQPASAEHAASPKGIAEVLFTSFIIQ